MKNMATAPQPAEAFLFKLEVTMLAPRYEVALDQLIRALRAGGVSDYRILSGVSANGAEPERPGWPGTELRAHAYGNEPAKPIASEPAKPAAPAPKSSSGSRTKSPEKPRIPEELMERLNMYIHEGRLVRLHVNKGRGVKMDFPGRILNLDQETRNMTVYHVDEKKVYIVALNEVDDIIE